MGSFKCNLCNRPMPPHIYKFHLKKSHPDEEEQAKVEANEKELETITATEAKTIRVFHPFDWGEVYPCAACGEEYPAKAMDFHSWVKHRV